MSIRLQYYHYNSLWGNTKSKVCLKTWHSCNDHLTMMLGSLEDFSGISHGLKWLLYTYCKLIWCLLSWILVWTSSWTSGVSQLLMQISVTICTALHPKFQGQESLKHDHMNCRTFQGLQLKHISGLFPNLSFQPELWSLARQVRQAQVHILFALFRHPKGFQN